MDKRRSKGQLSRAHDFLHCVIQEQQAATEELRASNRELQRLLEEMLATRADVGSVAADDPADPPAAPARPAASGRSATELKREAEAVLEDAASAVRDSVRLRRRSQTIRESLRRSAAKQAAPGQGLSKREHQVLALIVAGKSSKEIAAELGISFKTAVTHRASIMSKLDVHEIASVVREAIRRGLV